MVNDESTSKLSLAEVAALVVLMSEARELTNPEMKEISGFSLTGAPRTALVKKGLIESRRVGRSYANVLTDKGWRDCRQLSVADRPTRAGAGGGALYALLAGLQRSLNSQRLSHAEFFYRDAAAPDADGLASGDSDEPIPGTDDLDARIYSAYRNLAEKPGAWVGLAGLRDALGGASRAEVDAALRRMIRTPGVHLIPVGNLKSLGQADHDAAIVIGGEKNHALSVTDA